MRRVTSRFSTVCLAFVLAACSALPARQPAPLAGVDGLACVGNVASAPAGLVEQKDDTLLAQATRATGQGGVCRGKVYEVRDSVKVYRLWDSSRQNTLGQWWTFNVPSGSREAYRDTFAICRAWSALDRIVACTLKPGAKVVVGLGQSADCQEKTYPKSAVNQVYVPNQPEPGKVFVENCTTDVWPEG